MRAAATHVDTLETRYLIILGAAARTHALLRPVPFARKRPCAFCGSVKTLRALYPCAWNVFDAGVFGFENAALEGDCVGMSCWNKLNLVIKMHVVV